MILQSGIKAIPSVALILASHGQSPSITSHWAPEYTITSSFEMTNVPAMSSTYYNAILSNLSTIEEVEAIFVATDEDDVCHVYTVVDQHNPEITHKVIAQENKIEELFPTILFNFRVRANQGRASSQAVPVHSQPLFIK